MKSILIGLPATLLIVGFIISVIFFETVFAIFIGIFSVFFIGALSWVIGEAIRDRLH